MSAYITSDRLSDFYSALQKDNKSLNTISTYSRNINKLVCFLNGSELSIEQMKAYKNWLSEKGLKQRTINAYLAAANYFCEVMGWHQMKVQLEPLNYEEVHKSMCISLINYNKLIYAALQVYVKHEKIITGIIFRTKNGSLVNRSNFCKDLKKFCILAGVDENAGSIQHVKNVIIDNYSYYELKKHI